MEITSYSYHYLFIGLLFLFAAAFPILPLVAARLIAPRKPSATKNAEYECGLEAKNESWIQFRAQYYIFALLFVIFDIETVFIYPWAVAFQELGLFAFVEMIIFITILGFGLLYAWKKQALEWE